MLCRVVGEPDEITVESFVWDFGPAGNIAHLERHGITMADIEAVLRGNPLFFRNLPDRRASHVMIGRDGSGRSLYIALLHTTEAGEWLPVTGWQSALAHRLLEREGRI